jgi:hypothetical protein
MTMSARDAAMRTEAAQRRTEGPDERFAGYAVMGLPFASGHYLALRRFPSTPFERGYHAVWHRDPEGTWTFSVDARSSESCPRFFDAAIAASVDAEIRLTWSGPSSLTVEVVDVLTWTMELQTTAPTALMSGAGRLMPGAAWRSGAVLAAMGRMAGPILQAGRMELAGHAPNGQWYRAAPRRIWSVASSSAMVNGIDLGRPGELPRQAHIGDVPLPQRGIFLVGEATFEAFDPARHIAPRPALVRVNP